MLSASPPQGELPRPRRPAQPEWLPSPADLPPPPVTRRPPPWLEPLLFLLRRPIRLVPGIVLGVVAFLASDVVKPVAEATGGVALLLILLAALGYAARLLWPATRRGRLLLALSLPGAALVPLLGIAQADRPRGFVASRAPLVAALQDALLPMPPPPPLTIEAVRARLADPLSGPRMRPANADEALFNALIYQRYQLPELAAESLAESLRRQPAPRPDALLLHDQLWLSGPQAARAALAALPEGLPPAARAHLEAVRLPDPAARRAALEELLARDPAALSPAAALMRLVLAEPEEGRPTAAAARRILPLLARLSDAEAFAGFAAGFLDPATPARLQQEMRGLGPLRELAAKRLEIVVTAPPPDLPDAPMLLRITPPERWTAVQVQRGAANAPWTDVPQRAETAGAAADPTPTLRLPRPWRPTELRARYLDREGVVSEPVTFRFEPVAALREAAQRAILRQWPFGNYAPGRVQGNRLNPLPIPAALRPGLVAIEWSTDADPRTRRAEVAVADAAILAGPVPRTTVEFDVGPAARMLVLRGLLADGAMTPRLEMPIR